MVVKLFCGCFISSLFLCMIVPGFGVGCWLMFGVNIVDLRCLWFICSIDWFWCIVHWFPKLFGCFCYVPVYLIMAVVFLCLWTYLLICSCFRGWWLCYFGVLCCWFVVLNLFICWLLLYVWCCLPADVLPAVILVWVFVCVRCLFWMVWWMLVQACCCYLWVCLFSFGFYLRLICCLLWDLDCFVTSICGCLYLVAWLFTHSCWLCFFVVACCFGWVKVYVYVFWVRLLWAWVGLVVFCLSLTVDMVGLVCYWLIIRCYAA